MNRNTFYQKLSFFSLVLLCALMLFSQETATANGADGSVTFVYGDREVSVKGLKRGWGFAPLIQFDGKTVLFNTAGSEETLKNNFRVLGIKPENLDAIVISHEHWEMHEGMEFILEANRNVPVYVPQALLDTMKAKGLPYKEANLIALAGVEHLTENIIFQTLKSEPSHGGPDGIDEIHIILQTKNGLDIYIGCGHPGLMRAIEESKKLTGEDTIDLVAGGFHLPQGMTHIHVHDSGEIYDVPAGGNTIVTEADYKKLMTDLKAAGVQNVMPTHCTFELAEGYFKEAFGKNYIYQTLGMQLAIPAGSNVN